VVGSDGLWDVVTSFQLRDLLKSHLEMQWTVDGMARHLVATARMRRSFDNITAIVVLMKPPK